MAKVSNSNGGSIAKTNLEKVDESLQIEELLQELNIQHVESQSFAVKSLTNIFLDKNFGDSVTVMRRHLQVLKQNQDMIQKLLDYKLQF